MASSLIDHDSYPSVGRQAFDSIGSFPGSAIDAGPLADVVQHHRLGIGSVLVASELVVVVGRVAEVDHVVQVIAV